MKKTLSSRGVYEPKLSENDVLGQIRTLLELNGARVFRAIERVPKCYLCGCWLGSSEAGLPDLSGYFYKPTLVHPGLVFPLHFYIEIKRRGGKLRPSQERFIEAAKYDGAIAFKAESWDEVLAGFSAYGIKLSVK